MIEQEVRDMLQSKVRNAPALDEPPSKVLRRARSRRALNAAGLAAGLAVIAAGSLFGVRSLGTSKIEPATKIVKWVDLEAFKGHPAPTRPCNAGDFTFESGMENATNLSPTGPYLHLVPTSWKTSCKLALGSDAGILRLVDDAGRDMGAQVRADGLTAEVWGSADTFLFYEWANYCGPATSKIRYEISFPSGERLSTTGSAKLPRCTDRAKPFTLGMSPESGPAFLQQRGPGPGSVALPEEFSITLKAPETVRHSEVLHYQVVFTNVTDHDVSLDPCPDFVHELVRKTPEGLENHANGAAQHLNCAGADGPIKPGHSVAFEMQLQTGADELTYLPIGRWEIRWIFATGADPVTAPVFII